MTAKLLPADRDRAAAFVREVLDKPYADGASGPESFSCWGLAGYAQLRLFGRTLPVVGNPDDLQQLLKLVSDGNAIRHWPEVEAPEHGALVIMRNTARRHVGTWLALDGGGVLHTIEDAGVQFQSPLIMRAQGWGRLRFHAWRAAAP